MSRKVVVTGMGIWSCLGTDVASVREALYAGRSGIGIDEARLAYGYHSPLTGIVPTPGLKRLLDRRTRASMSEQAQYAYMATRQALQQSGITDDYLLHHDVGLLFGGDSSAKPLIDAHMTMLETHNSEAIGAGNVFQTMNSTVSMNLSTAFHLRGISLTVSAACASGSHAIGLAATLIRQGMQDIVVCGGAQEVNQYAMSSFDALNVFSCETDDPQKASRPFDRTRQGLVPSGGAAALILEDYDHAVARGATILAELAGYGFSSNGGGHLSTPSDAGSATAMQRAMDDAAITPSDVDYINAHATGTPQGDAIEARAIDSLFHEAKPWVSSTKSMTGHECWMAGASEAVYSIIMMQHDFVAPNINLTTPDDDAAHLNIARTTVDTPLTTVLSNSFGFGGTNSALVLRKIKQRDV